MKARNKRFNGLNRYWVEIYTPEVKQLSRWAKNNLKQTP